MADKYGFPKTQHSMIDRIKEGDEEARLCALSAFANSYRVPLMNFLVKCLQMELAEAEDLVQQFFLDKIMTGKVLKLANNKGRFRDALRTSLRNFLIDHLRVNKRERVERYFDTDIDISISASEEVEPIEMVWVTALFRTALIRMKNESQFWDLFYDRELAKPPLPYDKLVKKYGYDSQKGAKDKAYNHLVTAKRQFNRLLNECLDTQNWLSNTALETEYESEVELLKKLLKDPKKVDEIVKSLSDSCVPEPTEKPDIQHSIIGERVLFIDESPDESWSKFDAGSMIKHLLTEEASNFIDTDEKFGTRTLAEVLFEDSSSSSNAPLRESKALKDHFNSEGKAKRGSLPQRVVVTMTFVMIARFVTLGGEVEDITSMRRDVLTKRLEQLMDKDWIPKEIRGVVGQAISKLLA